MMSAGEEWGRVGVWRGGGAITHSPRSLECCPEGRGSRAVKIMREKFRDETLADSSWEKSVKETMTQD